ncbi:isoaspartyl peptidase/L-asparaginase family protein [Vibrio sp. 11986-1-5]|uniref:isoaspartyl peptidase/L-asparaginase family protein n=1 Tax=Vibrio sp. 11986-1-5 TaxID=2211215 RepID=UPI000D73B1CA|nr:isoaspartyl peptidase/L-asparaginase [Vibrio sp. 11986-1-5]PXA71480.1 isoaspartyl peptidase/L-asparaginase [Vibrio sp. 11986-1-5]
MKSPFAIAIHGGAGTIVREQMSASLQQEITQTLEAAVCAGHQHLEQGGDALDAVVAAVTLLEDSPLFNAGKGSVLTHQEMVEMDAAVMHGQQRCVGAIAGVKHIKNPVVLARDVLLHSEHVFLIGEGAETFAFAHGHPYTEQDYFFTERRYEQLLAMKASDQTALSESVYPDDKKYGTVGAVALDQQGNLAAATSTGGISNKRYGRVGDSPIIGAGTLAENGNVAISATGVGEYFIRYQVAGEVAARMRYLQQDLVTACETVIQGELKQVGGEGGLIAIDQQGHIHFAMNSSGMYRAAIDRDGICSVKIYADE